MSFSTKELCDLLECPVCMKTMFPPIYQCPKGHPICSTCKSKMEKQCPTCRTEIGDIRCLVLEKVGEAKDGYTCEYEAYGCEVELKYSTKLEHEKQCKFRPYDCPCFDDDCKVKGSIRDLLSHLLSAHGVETFSHKDQILLELPFTTSNGNVSNCDSLTWEARMYRRDNDYFLLRCELFKDKGAPLLIIFMQYMGEINDAFDYGYTVEVNKGERKAMWKGHPRSIREAYVNVRNSLDGLVLHLSMVRYFSGGNEKDVNLTVTCRVWKKY